MTGYIEQGIFFTPSLSPREDVSIETPAGLPRVYSDVTHERVKLGKNENRHNSYTLGIVATRYS